jgi:hypothetical protein
MSGVIVSLATPARTGPEHIPSVRTHTRNPNNRAVVFEKRIYADLLGKRVAELASL